MVFGEFVEERFTVLAQLQPDDATVVFVTVTRHKLVADGAIHQLDHRVVAQHQAVGRFTDRQAAFAPERLNRQEELVLLRVDPAVASSVLTERKEAPNRIAELVERPVIHCSCRN